MGQDFSLKLLRFIAAEMYVDLERYAARELFGQSLLALTELQRKELNEKLDAFVSPAFELMTEKNLTPPIGDPSGDLIH